MPTQVYKSIDGQIFDTYEECVNHETKINLKTKIDSIHWNFDSSNYDDEYGFYYFDRDNINDFILDNLDNLRELFKDETEDKPKPAPLDGLVNHEDSRVRFSIARNPKLTEQQITKLVGDEEWIVREAVADNPKLTKELIDRLVDDRNNWVRMAIATHPNLNQEQLGKLVKDEVLDVRNMALKHPLLNKE